MAGLAAPESIVVPDKMLAGSGINVMVDEVTQVDAAQRCVQLSDGRALDYDKLFLGMGAQSVIPPIEGIELNGVLALRGLDDAEKIRAYIAEKDPRHLLFVGAGFISLEVATLLASSGNGQRPVTIVELMDRPLPLMLDGEMAASVGEYLEEKGLTVLTGEKVSRIVGSGGQVTRVELASGKSIEADMVFVNVGVRPNTELAESAGLEMGRFGIKVNSYQETSDPHILAGGDCVEKINFVTSKPEGDACGDRRSCRGAWRPNAWPATISSFPVCSTPAGARCSTWWSPPRASPKPTPRPRESRRSARWWTPAASMP